MKKTVREREIIAKLKRNEGYVSTSELSRELFASESSIRRDLRALEKRGTVKRVYGGCELVMNHSGAIAFKSRAGSNVEAKKLIAKKAVSLIKDGDIIFLDQSSSAYYLADEIKHNASLTIVTNNIEILSLLSSSKMKVISSGGTLCEGNRTCLVGSGAESVFDGIYSDIMFFSARSLSDDGTISDTVDEEVAIRHVMMKNTRKRIFLCDSSKFGCRSAYKQCKLSDVDVLVTDGTLPKELCGECRVI